MAKKLKYQDQKFEAYRMDSICSHCLEYERVSRRDFLSGATAFVFGQSLLSLPGWVPRISLADPHVGPRGDTLVCVFLRGGADGLNIVVPHGDQDYHRYRPTIGIARPDDGPQETRTVDLDGFHGLHPALEPLTEIYSHGDLACIQAAGSPDETRSHFEAMALMERGAIEDGYSGWLARHLMTLDTGNDSALRAVGIGDMLQTSLSGAISATALQSIADYHLHGRDERIGEIQSLLRALYANSDDILSITADRTLATIDVLSKIDGNNYQPAGRAYPEEDFGQAMKTVAQLVQADVGVEVACVDFGGWDTHVAQGSFDGLMGNLLNILGQGLIAFYEDLQDKIQDVTVIVMSEFGRRARENGGLGTDHGHGNMMMIMGGGINGGKVFGRWPGLAQDQLVGPGDLAITTDYRHVLAEIIGKRLNNPRLDEVFPGFEVEELGLAIPRMK